MHLLETKIYWKQKKHFQKPVKTVDRMYIVQQRFLGGGYDYEGLSINVKVLNLFFSLNVRINIELHCYMVFL